MQVIIDSITDSIKNNFFQFVSESHAFIINHTLQTLFFTLAIYRVIMWILKKLNLFFAEYEWTEIILKTLVFILFLYLKVWNTYSAHLQILGYFTTISICINLYAGCTRLGAYFFSFKKARFGNISIILSFALICVSYKIFTLGQFQGQNKPKYTYLSIYCFLLLGFILIGLLRNQLIFSNIIILTIALIIVLRQWFTQIFEDSFLSKCNLPLEAFVYCSFAVQENYIQNKEEHELKLLQKGQVGTIEKSRNVKPSQFLLAQIYFFVFFLINKKNFQVQLVFGAFCLMNFIFRRGQNR